MNPRVNEYIDCPALCGTCENNYCLTCHPSLAYSSGRVTKYDNVTESAYLNCQSCNPACTNGCTGPSDTDCKTDNDSLCINGCTGSNENGHDATGFPILVDPMIPPPIIKLLCDPPCLNCDFDSNCFECPDYSDNLIYFMDLNVVDYVTENYYFCEECSSNCFSCSLEIACNCLLDFSGQTAEYFKDFNVCRKTRCPENCVSCDSNLSCVECKHAYHLDNGVCVSKNQSLRKCELENGFLCVKCSQFYYKSQELVCKKCPSNCVSCEESTDHSAQECSICKSGHYKSPDSKCFNILIKLALPLLNINMGLLVDTQNTYPNIKDKHLNTTNYCFKTKNDHSNICVECLQSFYLTKDGICLKCPLDSAKCKLKNTFVQISSCKDKHYLNTKIQKCLPCPVNCLSCDKFGCTKCLNSFELINKKCITCPDPNCEVCVSSSSCFRCVPGYVFSEDSKACVRCPSNCKYCLSPERCKICEKSYKLSSNDQCQQTCSRGTHYPEPNTKKCVSCSNCEYCSSASGSECSSCDICKNECSLFFSKISSQQFKLSSKDIVFPDSMDLVVSYFPDPSPPVIIESSGDSLLFSVRPHNALEMNIQTVLHSFALSTKKCRLKKDIPIILKVASSQNFFTSERIETVSKMVNYTKNSINSGVIVSTILPQKYISFNSIILLLNLNELFSYSFILQTPSNGFSEYLYKIFRINNLKFSVFSPYEPLKSTYFLIKSNEINIKAVNIFSYEFLLYTFVVVVYIYFKYFYDNKTKQKLNEISLNLSRLNFSTSKKHAFFKQIQSSLPRENFDKIKTLLDQYQKSNTLEKK